ncbi:MAG: radical SAM protein [Chloroflexi bacterium]|nr:radical SAM protein [Chloroflexota bacterium]
MGDCACDVTVDQLDQLSPPYFFFVELTSACNNDCPGCSNIFANRSQEPLPSVEWRRLLEQLGPHRPRLKITGGEPTLHPEFEAIIRHIQALGMSFTLFTNGRWQQPERLVSFLAEVPQLEGLLISLHGTKPESHEAFTCVPGSFEETIANIQLAVEAGLTVVISTVLTKHSCEEVAEVVALAQAMGADHVDFNRYVGKPLLRLEPSEKQLSSAIFEIERLMNGRRSKAANSSPCASSTPVRYGVPIPPCFVPNRSHGCLSGIAHVTIDPWGNVRPCAHVLLTCGNLLVQALEEIWHSAVMETWHRMIPEECMGCEEFAVCRGGCRATAMLRGLDRDPLCVSQSVGELIVVPGETSFLAETVGQAERC